MSKSNLVTSAKVCCYINGNMVGRVTAFRWSSDSPRKAAYGLDCNTPYELMPTTSRCSGSVSLLKITGDGGIESLGMAAHSSQMVREKYFSLTIVDRVSDTLLFRADYCSVTNQSWDIAERSLVRGTVSFEGLYWNNDCQSSKT